MGRGNLMRMVCMVCLARQGSGSEKKLVGILKNEGNPHHDSLHYIE